MEMTNEVKDPAVVDRLQRLGFKTASVEVKKAAALKNKMMLAYEFYRYIKPEHIQAFNTKLLSEGTLQGYRVLDFQSIEFYPHVPPADVLNALEEAQGRKCFDKFEVAYIRQVADPILFGTIDGCDDKFFIGQWDDDVKISDILTPLEG